MRTQEDICLLCKSRKATKTDSHIIPKFITKSVFGQGSQPRKGFVLDTTTADKPAKVIQDSAKENYILCPECEKYFEFIETYIAGNVHNRLWDPTKSSDFIDENNGHGIARRTCIKVNACAFRLLIYSIVWRCSISETHTHKSFKLDSADEEYLRKILCYFFALTHDELMRNVNNDPDTAGQIPFILFTSQTFSDTTGNVISSVPSTENPYYIELNQYTLLIAFKDAEKLETFDFLLNRDNTPIKLGFFKESFWTELKSKFLNTFQTEAVQRTAAKGQQPYINPKIK